MPVKRRAVCRHLWSQPSRQGDSEIGLFNGDLALTADFSARTISGCVGCNGGAYVDGYASDYLIRLGATPFESVSSGEHPLRWKVLAPILQAQAARGVGSSPMLLTLLATPALWLERWAVRRQRQADRRSYLSVLRARPEPNIVSAPAGGDHSQ